MVSHTLRINLASEEATSEMLGRLCALGSQVSIPYIPYQISKYSIGVLAPAGLDALSDLTLNTPKGTVTMRVMAVEANGLSQNGARYQLMVIDLQVDFEQIYTGEPKIKDLVAQSLIHFARFQTIPPAFLSCKTFGSSNPYKFKTVNASKSGIYMVSVAKGNVPFNESTLVEFSFENNDSWLLRGIRGTARIVHQNTHEGVGRLKLKYFGVELKEFKADGEVVWRAALESLERQTIERHIHALNPERTSA